MAVNWWERKEAGVDAQEGTVRDSISNAVFFLERSFKPPELGRIEMPGNIDDCLPQSMPHLVSLYSKVFF